MLTVKSGLDFFMISGAQLDNWFDGVYLIGWISDGLGSGGMDPKHPNCVID
jgi:hypothetical protein